MYKFTNKAKDVLENANAIARKMGHRYIGTEHILYGLVEAEAGIGTTGLRAQGITGKKVEMKIKELIGEEIKRDEEMISFTPRSKKVLENSYVESKKMKYNYIGTEQLLIGLLKEQDSVAGKILLDLNVNVQKIYSEMRKDTKDIKTREEDTEKSEEVKYTKNTYLNQFTEDLIKKAEEGKIDPVLGRNEEIERVIQILARRRKNNPCLVGEPRCG